MAITTHADGKNLCCIILNDICWKLVPDQKVHSSKNQPR